MSALLGRVVPCPERPPVTLRTVLVAIAMGAAAGAGLVLTITGTADAAPGPSDQPGTLGGSFGPMLPGAAVYPRQDIPIRFDHGRHLAQGLDCATCHNEIATSTRASESNFPRGETCDGCHGDAHVQPAPDERPACETCHVGAVDGRITRSLNAPHARLTFNHRLHAEQGASCETCHGDMSKVRLASELQLPSESTCLTCHDGTDAPGKATDRCGACHPTDASGRVVTRAFDEPAASPLIPRGENSWGMGHDLEFVRDHAAVAKANSTRCEGCHTERDCQDCHSGVLRPMRIHAPDYLTTHAPDARAMRTDCSSCHRLATDCSGCHDRTGVTPGGPDSAFGVGSPLRFHPAGWSNGGGGPQGHAFAAQRNLAACVSCHEEDTCMSCHATTSVITPGLGFSPHGAGFGRSLRCQTLATRNRRACLQCHAPGDPQITCR